MPVVRLPNGKIIKVDDSEVMTEAQAYEQAAKSSPADLYMAPEGLPEIRDRIARSGQVNQSDFYGLSWGEVARVMGAVPEKMEENALEDYAQEQKKIRDDAYYKEFGLGYILPQEIIKEADLGKGEVDPRLRRDLGKFDPHMQKLIQLSAEAENYPVPPSNPAPARKQSAKDIAQQQMTPAQYSMHQRADWRPKIPAPVPTVNMPLKVYQEGQVDYKKDVEPRLSKERLDRVYQVGEKQLGMEMLLEYLRAQDVAAANRAAKTALQSAIVPGVPAIPGMK